MKRLLPLFLLCLTACRSGTSEPVLSQAEVVNYLNGQPLVIPEGFQTTASQPAPGMMAPGTVVVPSNATGQPVKVEAETISMVGANITALSLGKQMQPATGTPFVTPVTFIYAAPDGRRYAVEATIEHRMVRNERAFFGFHIIRVAKQ